MQNTEGREAATKTAPARGQDMGVEAEVLMEILTQDMERHLQELGRTQIMVEIRQMLITPE